MRILVWGLGLPASGAQAHPIAINVGVERFGKFAKREYCAQYKAYHRPTHHKEHLLPAWCKLPPLRRSRPSPRAKTPTDVVKFTEKKSKIQLT